MDRRRFLATAGAAALVVGFDPVSRLWVGAAESRAAGTFDAAPALDGELRTDRASRAEHAEDLGHNQRVVPGAVLVPASALDIQKMVRFCRERGIPVAARGEHHSVHGQSLTPGLAIDMSPLSAVRSIAPTHAVVEAGCTWKSLLEQTLPHGLRPRVLPGFTGLSVGGHIAVGGCPMTGKFGGSVDSVRALEVVTGAGDLVACSEESDRELFDAVRGGLGQFGVVTTATVELVPALPMARTYLLHYVDAPSMFADLRILFDREEMEDVYNVCMPPGTRATFELQATVFYDPASPPDDAHLLRGLSQDPAAAVKQDRAYYDYATAVDQQIGALQQAGVWNGLVKPWYDVWLPDETVERHVTEVLAGLAADDVGPGGFILAFPHRPSRFRRPFYRVPPPNASDRIWLFDVLTTSALPGRDPMYTHRMERRNRRWWEMAKPLGGVRYAIGALPFSKRDWAQHYGEQWPEVQRRKRLYDPAGIMTPGLRIF